MTETKGYRGSKDKENFFLEWAWKNLLRMEGVRPWRGVYFRQKELESQDGEKKRKILGTYVWKGKNINLLEVIL